MANYIPTHALLLVAMLRVKLCRNLLCGVALRGQKPRIRSVVYRCAYKVDTHDLGDSKSNLV